MKPELNLVLPTHIDNTQLVAFRSCPRKWMYEFGYGLRSPMKSVDLHFGGVFAAGAETYRRTLFETKDAMAAMEAAYERMVNEWGDYEPPSDTSKTFANCVSALGELFQEFNPLTDPIQPYEREDGGKALEFTFAIPVDDVKHAVTGEPWILAGRFDMLGLYHDLPVVVDEKTTKSLGQYWFKQWPLRSQFMNYCWAAQQMGYPVKTAIINGIGILKTRIDVVRHIQQYPQHLIDRWYEETCNTLRAINQMYQDHIDWDVGNNNLENEGFRFNFGDTCSSYGGCNYITLCESPDWRNWTSDYAVDRWDPLDRIPVKGQEEAA